MNRTINRLLCLFSILAFTWGCQSDVAMSRAVRTGDTITVSLGNADPTDNSAASITKANVEVALLKKENITAYIASHQNLSLTYDVNIRYLFRSYADPTAFTPRFRGQGMWMAVLDLANSAGTPVPLPVGDATITFSSNDFDLDHLVEVHIVGTGGTPHNFISKTLPQANQKFTLIEPAPQARVSVSGSLPNNTPLGAAKYVFDVEHVDDLSSANNPKIAASPARFPTEAQVTFHVVKEDSLEYVEGNLVSLYLTAPEGLSATELGRFDFVMTSGLDDINNDPNYWKDHHELSVYYDINGVEIQNPTFLDDEIGLIE